MTTSQTPRAAAGEHNAEGLATSEWVLARRYLHKIRMPPASNQQRRRAEIMPGGVVVELEIAMPSSVMSRMSANGSTQDRSQCRDCHHRRSRAGILRFLRPNRVPA